ncbi:hypothetical protein lacNasYZ03_11280 [Lactobacillus nasalidis]|uniref:IrrE N-terminal-like domain-containing protein n=1 Tax=Lactobacillus nasalidis TaxID=2797258 RepID=A0ABQ3W4J2_9LACO|nr:ImmA/IrrE family metallo-endopeptidase [Lactobacillus nasalidis]GHV97851.1 hypothetical protein lacNasYZ01_10330 [Lactobacillus nasalidis]GHW00081.1 hypothetical protein lacNasYZ02_15100 [Lactobacillus nasalidis]GHW01441.1 hypothetical protein lacNasYZ03_11280 [Lactobacillus nasalidis]
MDNAIDFAINAVLGYGVGIEITYQRPDFKSCAVVQHNLVIINPNANPKPMLPFVILHELGHIVLAHHELDCVSPSAKIKQEHEADEFSTELIWTYSQRLGISYNNAYDFMSAFGIPSKMFGTVVNLMKFSV